MRYIIVIVLFIQVLKGGLGTSLAPIIELNPKNRIALLISNYKYKDGVQLSNITQDIQRLAETLQKIGFKVTIKYNLQKEEMNKTLLKFKQDVQEYEINNRPITFFYYSGHGNQVDGIDYFVPIKYTHILKYDLVEAKNFVNNIYGGLNLFFIDTSRAGYYDWREKNKYQAHEMKIRPNRLLMYSTGAGEESLDTNVFIKRLSTLISTPNKSIIDIANDLSMSIVKETKREQIPSLQIKEIDNIILNPLSKKQNIKKKGLTNWYKKQYALVIGISKYKNNAISYLPNALNDANSIAELLKKQGVNVTVLKNKEATKRNILKTIKNIKKKLSKDDSVLVYFSGHGKGISLVSHKRVGYIIPYDFDASLKSNDLMDYDDVAISLDSLKKYMHNYSAKHILLMLDSCFSGLTFESRALEQVKKRKAGYYDRLLNKKAINILTAGADEQVADGIGKHSPFTYYLLKALRDGNVDIEDGDQIATFSELAMYVKLKVGKETNGKQTPQYSKNNFDGEFIFKIP